MVRIMFSIDRPRPHINQYQLHRRNIPAGMTGDVSYSTSWVQPSGKCKDRDMKEDGSDHSEFLPILSDQ